MALKLSFILPCYNVERYIADCLDSIYVQDMPEEEFEVICVNDCSTDGTRSIIIDYSQRHSNLTLIDHENNMSVGEARNTGIRHAKGEYIWFVDTDDMIALNSARAICEIAKKKDVDVLMFNYEVADERIQHIKKDTSFSDSDVLSGQDFVVKYFSNQFSRLAIVWRCLFRTSFLRKNELEYPRMIKAEDVSFFWKVLLHAEKVGSVEDSYYLYRRNPFSVANKLQDAHVFFSERILFGNQIVAMLNDGSVEIQWSIREDMLKSLKWCANSNLNIIFTMTKEEQSKYYDEVLMNRDVVDNVKPYMNRKSRMLFSTIGGRQIWVWKVFLMSLLFGKKAVD